MIDQGLVKDADNNVKLGGFVRVVPSVQNDRNIVNLEVDAGLNWFEPIPGRPDDVAGAAVTYVSFENDYIQTEQAAGNFLGTQQTIFELTYLVSITEWFSVQPSFQLVLDPQGNPAAMPGWPVCGPRRRSRVSSVATRWGNGWK